MKSTKAVGASCWAIAGGRIPVDSAGPEPQRTSHDRLCFLNAGDAEAQVEITIFYADREPVGPYRLRVAARRVRQVRLNDLIDPGPIPLGTDYGCVVNSDVPVLVEFARLDTTQPAGAQLGFPAHTG